MSVKHAIAQNLIRDLKVFKKNFLSGLDFQKKLVETISPTEKEFGEYTLKISFALKPFYSNKSPYQLAQEIYELIKKNPLFATIEVVPPGFINFSVNHDIKKKKLKELWDDPLEKITNENPQKILIEYVSANPTGPLHIGHGRWAVVGNVLQNIFNYAGHQMEGEFYINDAGKQIENLLKTVKAIREKTPIPEDGYHGDYLKKYQNNNLDVVADLINQQKNTLKKLKVQHDYFFSEKSLHRDNKIKSVLDFLVSKDLAYWQDDALWFRSTLKEDEKDRVLIKSDGNYTYFAVDIVYHFDKVNRGYNLLIDLLGADHHGYVKRIKNAVSILSEDKTPLMVLIGQNVLLKQGKENLKMSKRDGTFITLDELLEEIPVDVVNYFFSMRHINTPLEFDFAIAKKQSLENPVYYIQYAHARICSVLAKAKEQGILPAPVEKLEEKIFAQPTLNHLIIHLLEFYNEIVAITKTFEVHRLNNYIYKLSEQFHKLYNEMPFLKKSTEEELKFSQSTLAVLLLIRKIIAKGLGLLAIEPKNQM